MWGWKPVVQCDGLGTEYRRAKLSYRRWIVNSVQCMMTCCDSHIVTLQSINQSQAYSCMNFIIFLCDTLKLSSRSFVPLLAPNPGDARAKQGYFHPFMTSAPDPWQAQHQWDRSPDVSLTSCDADSRCASLTRRRTLVAVSAAGRRSQIMPTTQITFVDLRTTTSTHPKFPTHDEQQPHCMPGNRWECPFTDHSA